MQSPAQFRHLAAITMMAASLCSVPLYAQPGPSVHRVTLSAPGSAPAALSGIVGLGIEFDPYEHPPTAAHWRQILDRVAYMRPGFLRVMSSAADYCSGFSADGSPAFRWVTDPEAPELKRLYAVLDFAQAHHTPVYLGEWAPPRALGIGSPDDPRWISMIAHFVSYLVRQRHYTVIHGYIFMNEPNGAWMWPGGTPSYDAWSAGVKQLRSAFDREGLADVLLAGPDNSGDPSWFARSVAELHLAFGAWEQHVYATDDQLLSDSLEQQLRREGALIDRLDPAAAAKHRFIAESGIETGKLVEQDQQPRVRDRVYGTLMADYVAQVLRAGWQGADAWDLDDAMHGNGHGGLKLWGFWDSSVDADIEPRPWAYAWTTLSRALPPGAISVPLELSPGTNLRAAMVRWGSGEATVVLVNESATAERIELPKLSVAAPLFKYDYFESQLLTTGAGGIMPTSLDSFPAAVSLPSRGFSVLTTAGPAVQPEAESDKQPARR